MENVRWLQRFSNFKKAILRLNRYILKKELSDLEEEGFIKAFEYTFELAWKTLQDLLKYKGYENILGPKPVINQSFKDGYIIDGENWVLMHKSRNLTTHIYNEEIIKEISKQIRETYFKLFLDLKNKLEIQVNQKNNSLFE